MCEAIRNYIDREIVKENFKKEALESWENYQETKLHLTANEVQDWLDSWGTEKEQKAPKCHE
jgi:predicted transcriptional regulator